MKIDGYTPVDKTVALEQGVSFDYKLDFGTVTIRSRTLNMRDNPQFAMAFKMHQDWAQRRQSLSKTTDQEAERRFLGILYDHGVISWETTITSGGNRIEPTRQNFIDMMMSDACQRVAVVYFADAVDERNFRPVDREEDAGNSAASSAGSSSGAGGARNSSAT